MMNFDHESGEYLDLGDAKIYYEVIGNQAGPALLLLHGGFGNIEDFNGILFDLTSKYKVIGIDSRGHGKSTAGSQKLTYELLQKDVERILQHLNVDAFTIIGFSDGGIVGFRLAALTNLKVNHLITIGAEWHKKNVEPLTGVFLTITGESWKKKFPSDFESYQRLNPQPDFNHLAKQLVAMWLDTSASGYPNERVKDISCPLFILRGENDPIVSEIGMAELSKTVPNALSINIPFAGHVAFKDQKEIFLIRLREFLSNQHVKV